MECFFSSLKTEWVSSTEYQGVKEAKNSIIDCIIGYYCQVRPHQYNGGLTPNESERLFWNDSKNVVKFN